MEMINAEEKEEMLRLAGSSSLKEDMHCPGVHSHNPLIVDGRVSMDRMIAFLNDYNEFINHMRRPFKPISDKGMKL